MSDQFPSLIDPLRPGAVTAATALDIHLVPALVADAGEHAGWRYIDFFTANIRNANTRRAYARACSRFFAWCEERGLTLATMRPYDAFEQRRQARFRLSNCSRPWDVQRKGPPGHRDESGRRVPPGDRSE